MDSRRDFLKKAATLAGAAGLSAILPSSIQKALAINPPPGSTFYDAEHVVILMQENRSFDHVFGTLKGVRGFNDPRAITLPNGNPVWLQSNANKETYAPFHLDIRNSKSTWMNSLPHAWSNQVNARNEGKYDKWLDYKASGVTEYSKMPLTLGYHNREDIPFYYSLADAFTVCDQNFCSSLTGTTPNRLFFWSGTIREKQNANSRANVWNEDVDFSSVSWPTFPERLEDHGVSWKVYQNEVSMDVGLQGEHSSWLANFTDNPLEFFEQYNIKLYENHILQLPRKEKLLLGELKTLRDNLKTNPGSKETRDAILRKEKELSQVREDLKTCTREHFDRLSPREKNLHTKAFTSNSGDPDYHELEKMVYTDNGETRELMVPKGDVLYQFREDVKTGKLPTVSWLVAPENFSDHPGAPWYGAWYVSEVLDILTQNPEVWKKTIFILNYDENDGYFDHVPPFVAPHPARKDTGRVSDGIDTSVEYVTKEQEDERKDFPIPYEEESPIGLGYRVPMIIASPWTRGGYVNSEVFDHTSCLQFLEHFLSKKTGKKISEPNISDWRRTICGDLTSAFRPYNGEPVANPEFIDKEATIQTIHKAKYKPIPAGYKQLTEEEIAQIKSAAYSSSLMPKQEEGIKASCALPYELYCDGNYDPVGKALVVKFQAGNKAFGSKAVGAPFNVYAPGEYRNKDGFEPVRTWSYAVKAGDELTDSWGLADFRNENYHLRVYGPNGFFREFAGNAKDPQLSIVAEYHKDPRKPEVLSGNLLLHLANHYTKPLTVEIVDNAYKRNNHKKVIKPGMKTAEILSLNLQDSRGWYDFTIKVAGYPEYHKRYAGRVETGREGITDPYMGRAVSI